MRNKFVLLELIMLLSNIMFSQDIDNDEFNKVNSKSDWNQMFYDSGKDSWQTNWFLDGLRADIKNTEHGMVFSAGSVEGDDGCHAVLWTKDSFNGDIKIEYEYTRTDTRRSQVNILYIQATGIKPLDEDISEWNNLRIIPSMKTYFNNINTIHISYAAYSDSTEYIRARKYPVISGQDFNTTTEIPSAYFNTDLFTPGKTYKITVIKNDKWLFFNVKCEDDEKLYAWDISGVTPLVSGRIGLRHMYTRSAMYKNIKIYERR